LKASDKVADAHGAAQDVLHFERARKLRLGDPVSGYTGGTTASRTVRVATKHAWFDARLEVGGVVFREAGKGAIAR